MKARFLIILAIVLIFLNAPSALAFECKYPLDYSKLVEGYDYVFVAEVQDIDPAENDNNEMVIFNLYLSVKGDIPGYVFEMEQEKNSFTGINFEIGKAYNVFVNDGNPMSVDSCSTLPLDLSENYENYPHDIIQCGQDTTLIDGVCVVDGSLLCDPYDSDCGVADVDVDMTGGFGTIFMIMILAIPASIITISFLVWKKNEK